MKADEIIDTFVDVLDENDRKGKRSDTVICWALTALSKLSIRLPGVHEKVKELVEGYLKLYLSRVTKGFSSAKVTELPQMQKINSQQW